MPKMRCSSVISCLICGPCICAWLSLTFCFCPSRLRRRGYAEAEKECFERRQHSAPRPVAIRKRALTIPLPPSDTDVSEKRSTYSQSDSPLFKLPLELRQTIYTALLGDTTLHIVRKNRRLGHLKCKAQSRRECPIPWERLTPGEPPRNSCLGVLDKDGVWQDDAELTNGDIIPFLQTCRQAYSEAVPIVYTSNTFAFNDLDCIRYLSATIIPARLHTIRSLSIAWYFRWPSYDSLAQRLLAAPMYPPHDEASWEDCWRIIASMKGLRRVDVRIRDSSNISDADKEKKMLAPLWQVKHVPIFTISLDWQGQSCPEAPFTVLRPTQPSGDEVDPDGD